MFEINIQAAIGSKIIASARIPPLEKMLPQSVTEEILHGKESCGKDRKKEKRS